MPVFNAICLGSVPYRTGLVPRILPAIGLIGAPLLVASDIAIFFGRYDRMAPTAALPVISIAVWAFRSGSTSPSRVSGRRPPRPSRPLTAVRSSESRALSGDSQKLIPVVTDEAQPLLFRCFLDQAVRIPLIVQCCAGLMLHSD